MKQFASTLFLALFSSALFAQATFTSSGQFTVPAGVDTITVELIGAGGNGASNGGAVVGVVPTHGARMRWCPVLLTPWSLEQVAAAWPPSSVGLA